MVASLGISENDGSKFEAKFAKREQVGRGTYAKVYRVEPLHPENFEDPSFAVKVLTKRLAATDPLAKKKKQLENAKKQLDNPGNDLWEEDIELLRHMIRKLQVEVSAATSQSPMDTINQEVALLRRFKHRNIMEIIDVYESPKTVSLVLTYCPANLGAFLLQNPSIQTCQRFSRDLSQAVAKVHELGIVHRDIKPENCALSAEVPDKAILLLADFGLAHCLADPKSFGEPELSSSVAGTPLYMGPELMTGRLTKAGDTWAVGATIFELMTKTHLSLELLNLSAGEAANSASAKSTGLNKSGAVSQTTTGVDPSVLRMRKLAEISQSTVDGIMNNLDKYLDKSLVKAADASKDFFAACTLVDHVKRGDCSSALGTAWVKQAPEKPDGAGESAASAGAQ